MKTVFVLGIAYVLANNHKDKSFGYDNGSGELGKKALNKLILEMVFYPSKTKRVNSKTNFYRIRLEVEFIKWYLLQ